MLCAVLERHVDFLAKREGELLDIARSRPNTDAASVVEAIVRPATELADSDWRGRCFIVILAELVEEDPAALDPAVLEMLARTGGYAVYALLEKRMAKVKPAIRVERVSLATDFILRAVAERTSR